MSSVIDGGVVGSGLGGWVPSCGIKWDVELRFTGPLAGSRFQAALLPVFFF